MYRFKIRNAASDQFSVRFSYNAEIMVWSENYVSKSGAHNCIASLKANTEHAPIIDTTIGETGKGYRFEIAKSTDDQYFIRFRAPSDEIMVRSERYTVKHNAKNCAQSVKDNAASAEIIDETISKAA